MPVTHTWIIEAEDLASFVPLNYGLEYDGSGIARVKEIMYNYKIAFLHRQ